MEAGIICNRQVRTIYEDDTLINAARRMLNTDTNALVVISREQKSNQPIKMPVALLKDYDIVMGGMLVCRDEQLRGLRVHDVMSHELFVVYEHTPLDQAFKIMHEHHVHYVPVLDDSGALFGLLSLDQLLAWVAEELNHAAEEFDRDSWYENGLSI